MLALCISLPNCAPLVMFFLCLVFVCIIISLYVITLRYRKKNLIHNWWVWSFSMFFGRWIRIWPPFSPTHLDLAVQGVDIFAFILKIENNWAKVVYHYVLDVFFNVFWDKDKNIWLSLLCPYFDISEILISKQKKLWSKQKLRKIKILDSSSENKWL